MSYSEHDRQRIAEKEYEPKLVEGRPVEIESVDGTMQTIGTVSQIIDDEVIGIIEEVTYEKNPVDSIGSCM